MPETRRSVHDANDFLIYIPYISLRGSKPIKDWKTEYLKGGDSKCRKYGLHWCSSMPGRKI